ncbi:CapA family protein [Clostridium sp. 'deep sea']|uniref:CapA family protein n=1 Tax=Clostridium sp. 'deep sea' TaxID=2779445 RepID=UPI001896585C|nr:CapA family protein [Clostridium sp. 'deep sea']QOR34351.1 CapA family protein [Clostridium sp. 'deep sea']
MRYNDQLKKFTLTATGDIFITRRLTPYNEPAYLEMWNILKNSDIKFTNFEMLVHDFNGYPVAESGGTYTQVDSEVFNDLQFAGFNLYSLANNHSLDYGIKAMLHTKQLLKIHKLVNAGTGINLADARSASYLDLNCGRVALIAASSTFASFGRAGHARVDSIGRPGLNPVRFHSYIEVDDKHYNMIKELEKHTGIKSQKQRYFKMGWLKSEPSGVCKLENLKFIKGNNPGIHTIINDQDRAGNIKWIKDASDQADIVVYSLHLHQGDAMNPWKPAEFQLKFAHECINAGADVFIAHGAHYIRGIEIYNNKPIFHGLGNFIFQNETVLKLPQDVYDLNGLGYDATPADYYNKRSNNDQQGFPTQERFWQTVLPWCRFNNGKVVEIKLYPITLGFGKKRTVRGRPMLAKDEEGERILNRIRELSAPFGTKINIINNIGIVEL